MLYPINSKDKNDEIISMLGASYFRVMVQVGLWPSAGAWQLIPPCHR
ncbi:hypothetical protein ACNKHU_06330 [Shigella flexneri]